MNERSVRPPRPFFVTACAVTLALLWAGTATATTAQFYFKKCLAKAAFEWDDEDEAEKEKDRFKKFFVDGRFGSPIAWRLKNDFPLSFAARLDSQRKAIYIEDAGLDAVTVEKVLDYYALPGGYDLLDFDIKGNRKVDRKFKKSTDKVKVDFYVEFTDGVNMGRGLQVRWGAKCRDGKRRD